MSVKHSGWQSRIDWWSSGCEDEIETYKIKEYEKQIKSDNVGGGSAAVAAVECKMCRLPKQANAETTSHGLLTIKATWSWQEKERCMAIP